MTSITGNERIYLRKLTQEDFAALSDILADKETMYAYEAPYTEEQIQNWLNWNLRSYDMHGFGLWAIIDKQTDIFVGQCGIIYSEVEGKDYLEIGYLLNKKYWKQGYAAEAALLCKDYARVQLNATAVHSIIRDTNTASQKVAKRMGMTPFIHYNKDYSGIPIPHIVFKVDL